MVTIVRVTTADNIESAPEEAVALPAESQRNVFDGTVYRCYMPGSTLPTIAEPEPTPEE